MMEMPKKIKEQYDKVLAKHIEILKSKFPKKIHSIQFQDMGNYWQQNSLYSKFVRTLQPYMYDYIHEVVLIKPDYFVSKQNGWLRARFPLDVAMADIMRMFFNPISASTYKKSEYGNDWVVDYIAGKPFNYLDYNNTFNCLMEQWNKKKAELINVYYPINGTTVKQVLEGIFDQDYYAIESGSDKTINRCIHHPVTAYIYKPKLKIGALLFKYKNKYYAYATARKRWINEICEITLKEYIELASQIKDAPVEFGTKEDLKEAEKYAVLEAI